MDHSPHAILAGWESFYVILGTSAAALTGLQFVVMALIAEMPQQINDESIGAFGTPTVVHFCQVLLLSGLIAAPWPDLVMLVVPLALSAGVGLFYMSLVFRRARRQRAYRPVAEDWLWHVALPFVAYAGFMAAALSILWHEVIALFTIGAVAILLVFIGIHNSWDTIEYMTLKRRETPE